jgi:hypothetical protein
MKITNIGKKNQLNTNLQYVLISKLSYEWKKIYYIECMSVMNNLLTSRVFAQVLNNLKLK